MRRAKLRDRILIASCALVAAIIIVAMTEDFRNRSTVPVDSIDYSVASASSDTWTLQFLGDTMLGDRAQPLLDQHGYDWPLLGIKPLLTGDFVVANAEAPMSVQTVPADPGKPYSYHSDPRAAAGLRSVGIDALGLGNNHSMDQGPAGLRDTMKFAAANDLVSFGAGQTLAEAERPVVLRSAAGTIGIVSLGENFGRASRATADTAGMVVLSPETIQRGFDLARAAGADWVVADVHWGDTYSDTNAQQRYWARMLVDAGYDLVVGTGSHLSAPIEFIGSVPVAYSLGNFVFGAPGRFKRVGKEGIGLSLSVELHRNGPTQLAVSCMLTNNRLVDYIPQPCTPEKTLAVMPTINPNLVVQGNVARMPCDCFVRENRDG